MQRKNFRKKKLLKEKWKVSYQREKTADRDQKLSILWEMWYERHDLCLAKLEKKKWKDKIHLLVHETKYELTKHLYFRYKTVQICA